jgi:hypothetical protein
MSPPQDAGTYARTYVDFWTGNTGRQMRQFPAAVRELAHFLYSGPGVVSWGLFYKPIEQIAHDTGRQPKQIDDAMKTLAGLDFAYYDAPTEFVWVKQMAANQHRPLPLKSGDNRIKAVRRWYAGLSPNPFLGPYFDHYDVGLRLSDPLIFSGSEVMRREEGAAEFSLEPTQALAVRGPSPTAIFLTDFEEWWLHYPEERRIGKGDAKREWLAKRPKHEELPRLIAMLEAQKQTDQWRKSNGQFIPKPENYIKGERWSDAVTRARPALSKTSEGTAQGLREFLEES